MPATVFMKAVHLLIFCDIKPCRPLFGDCQNLSPQVSPNYMVQPLFLSENIWQSSVAIHRRKFHTNHCNFSV